MIDERSDHHNRFTASAEKRQFVAIFQRAAVQHDSHARQRLQRATHSRLLEYLRRHPFYQELQRIATDEQYITHTFERFWQRVDQQHLHMDTRPVLLRYLQATLNGLILEALRPTALQQEIPPFAQPSPRSPALWRILQEVLPDERERRVAYLLYHCGLKPVEIVRAYPQEFTDVQEIHRVRYAVIEKMRTLL